MMEEFVREKRFWIYTKLAEKETLRVEAPRREFVTGEGHPYLGHSPEADEPSQDDCFDIIRDTMAFVEDMYRGTAPAPRG